MSGVFSWLGGGEGGGVVWNRRKEAYVENRVGEIELIFKPRKSLYIIAILMFGENNLKSRCYFC